MNDACLNLIVLFRDVLDAKPIVGTSKENLFRQEEECLESLIL